MELTSENKATIDGLSQDELLRSWRFAPAGDPWFQGATGEYWGKRIAELQRQNPAGHVRSSKQIGW